MSDATDALMMPSRPCPRSAKTLGELRVALVTGSYNYIRDGIALTLNRLVGYLEAQGVRVLVIAPTAKTPALPHKGDLLSVPSIPLPARPEYRLALGLSRRARQELEAFQPHIMHIAVPDLLGYRALRFAQRKSLPVVASYHTRYENYLTYYGLGVFRRPVTSYLKWFYGSCLELYAPSASMIETLQADGIATQIRLWSRGVDTDNFHPAKRSSDWRSKHGIADHELVVCFVSRLVREKELDTLADVLDGLRRLNVAYRSVIVGDGPDRKYLQERLPESIFTGFLAGDELARAYACSDIFLFPSDTETFGNVTLEAMASGLATVCADACGSSSLVVPGVTGFLAKPRHSQEFIEAIQRLANDAALRASMRAAARERSLAFSWDSAMGQLLGYYRELLAMPASREPSHA
jgi:glycosyltransferase involved in cell wall biosynthesis